MIVGARRTLSSLFGLAVIGLLFLGQAASAQSSTRIESGELGPDDSVLDGGEHFDRYSFEGNRGQVFMIDMRSSDFDPLLRVHRMNESGDVDEIEHWLNDDFGDSLSHSRLEIDLPEDGMYVVYATSFRGGETGRYELSIEATSKRVETGALREGDDVLDSGEYYDVYRIDASAGETYVIDLHSDHFDTYLSVRGIENSKLELDNDDHDGSTRHSQVQLTTEDASAFEVSVTSYESGESGAYRLTIQPLDASAQSGPVFGGEIGALDPKDDTLESGEFRDLHHFEGTPGQHVRIELRSDDFDTYLILQEPGGDTHENDDFDGRVDLSVIDQNLTAHGTYEVVVTSFEAEETGSYELLVTFDEFLPLVEDGPIPGSLDDRDSLLEGHFVDRFSVSLTAGVRSTIRMESDEFDTLLRLTYPDGTEVEFDDDFGNHNATIDLIPEESGEYGVTATSFDRKANGDYAIHVKLAAPRQTAGQGESIPVAPDRRIFGVFVGLSDYEGNDGDLDFCDRDAEVLHHILQREFSMQSDDSVLLLNKKATVERVTNAVTQIGERAGPDDLLIFFYSGHGGQMAGAEDAFDPDGIHETLSLYDGDLKDDDFAALFNSSAAGIALVAIDACHSGGFAKDVVSTKGRMGVFSSAEDVLSIVPGRFRAGGYLSRFLAEAVSERRYDSDQNADGQLTSHELSRFLEERYLHEVRSTKETQKANEEYVDPSESLSFQRIVIDRGGLSRDRVLFNWN